MTTHTDAPDLADAAWELYSHGADVGIRGWGAALERAFESVALALTAVVCDPVLVLPKSQALIKCSASDNELLLYEWVNALVYEMATRRMLFSRFRVLINNLQLSAEAWGEPLDPERHEPAVEVKGATWTDLKVSESGGRWTAQCIVDV